MEMTDEFKRAKKEIGETQFNKHYKKVFEKYCLDFVNTIVFNLPEPCYANCDYCIDKYLMGKSIGAKEYLNICAKVISEFPTAENVSITGGSLKCSDFVHLVEMIKSDLPNASITWNTNGINISKDYADVAKQINHVNLHRNSPDENENIKIFKASKPVLSINEANNIFKDKLCLRITVDENFNIDDYVKFGLPLYLNRLLPGNEKSNAAFNRVLQKLDISRTKDIRRRNVYLQAEYKNIPVRICLGDKLATHIPNRKPIYLNVAIVHRSGVVCGSWYEDDKTLLER